MENWDFSVLTGASLIPLTEKKKILLYFMVFHFFSRLRQSRLKEPSDTISMSNSFNLDDNKHFASLIRV